MNHLNAHPIFATLASNAADLFSVDLDDKELERVMDQDSSILGVRVVAFGNDNLPEHKGVAGTLTSRVRAMITDAEGCTVQQEFRDKVIYHPAYSLVVDEITEAYQAGKLFEVFDSLEAIGVVAAYSKKDSVVSLGLNAQKMSMGIREHKRMFSSNNQRSIAFVNNEGGILDLNKPKEDRAAAPASMTTTYYLTFKV